MTKSELRTTYLKMRNSLSGDELTAKSRQIAHRFFENIDLKLVVTLHTFISIEKFNEIDTSLIYERIWREFPHLKTLAPRANLESSEIEHIEFDAETELIENKWGIREPANGESVPAGEIDIVIVPLLCFDTRGYRVGYGKGFYDRFLSRCRADCLKIGLSYFAPVEAIDNVDSLDVPLDFCIMPEAVLTTKNRTRMKRIRRIYADLKKSL